LEGNAVLSVLNAKYVHLSPAPWCLAAGVLAFAPELYERVRIVEGNINQADDEMLSRILAERPALVGFSCYIWNITKTLTLCRRLREALPGVLIVLGGPEVSYCAGEVLRENPAVDFVLAGEGEESFPALLRAVLKEGAERPIPPEASQNISGLSYRTPDGGIIERPPCHLTGSVPSPLTAGYAEAVRGRIAYIETSRGCPYRCAFCLSGGEKPRYFEMDPLFGDLLKLAKSGARTIKFVDRTFNANPEHCNEILRFILARYGREIPEGACFHFEIAGDILREETFGLLEQMPPGAVQLEIGMQSFHEKTLEAIRRKTDTARLEENIRRLVDMGRMHIHIDLIAGLPFEDLPTFAGSFNTAYSLGAHNLQLGFLKLLHGSAMRTERDKYPCRFHETPPYEVIRTPWLTEGDIRLLHRTENALEKVYNSGRFRTAAAYVLGVCGMTPFDLYTGLGEAIEQAGMARGAALDDFTALFKDFCENLPGVDRETLRDAMVQDRLATNSTGGLPPCLIRQDEQLTRAVKWLSKNPETAPRRGVRRGAAILYGAGTLCWADYDPKARSPVTGRWPLREIPLEVLP
jgi:radical SAM superfamily enzyme YgiQ (UPF0313 family)